MLFLGVDVLKLSLGPFVWDCLKKPIEVREFRNIVKNIVSQAKKHKKEMRFCSQKLTSCYIMIPGKKPVYLGNLLTCIDVFCEVLYLSSESLFSLPFLAKEISDTLD